MLVVRQSTSGQLACRLVPHMLKKVLNPYQPANKAPRTRGFSFLGAAAGTAKQRLLRKMVQEACFNPRSVPAGVEAAALDATTDVCRWRTV